MSTLEASDSIDWKAAEDALFLIAANYIEAFGTAHRTDTFYGLAFDCNSDYAQVFVCANTAVALNEEAQQYRTRFPDRYGHLSIEEVEEKLRWAMGDWKFQAFTTDGFSNAWETVEEFLMDAYPWADDDDGEIEEFRTAFMETACRCMIRLETQGIFNALVRTEDFRTFVADHGESEEDSWNRYNAVRRDTEGA